MSEKGLDIFDKRMIDMIIQNSAINIKFPRVDNIKKSYILNEEILKQNFNEANILPIPDDAPSEIPRIMIKTKGEHSQLSIAPGGLNFETVYTHEYVKNWSLCEEYLNTRVNDIYTLTDKITGGKHNYIGIVTNLIWDDIEDNGNKILFENLFGKKASKNLDDIVVRYTYVENNRYYVNISLQSVRLYGDSSAEEAGSFAEENLKAHTVSITLDVNDRYSFNMEKEYVSTKETFKDIMGLTTDIISNKLKELVEKGEYRYEKK